MDASSFFLSPLFSQIVGSLSLPIGAIIRLLPTAPFAKFLYKIHLYRDPDALPVVSPASEDKNWNSAITQTIDNLSAYTAIRGGRLRSSSIVLKSRSAQLKEKNIQPTSLLAMIPTLIATSVGAGWTPTSSNLADPSSQDPSASSQALAAGKITIHPDTDKNDPLWKKFGNSRV